MNDRTSYEVIMNYLPARIRLAMSRVPEADRRRLCEVRLRNGRPVSFVYPHRFLFLTESGGLTATYTNADCLSVSCEEISETVEALCRYSVHSCVRELRQGYFILSGGIRVGAAGTGDGEHILRDFSSLNFRLARNVPGCADEVVRRCGWAGSILICGGVNSGKTTLLRDLCRSCGSKMKAALIDERNEIASVSDGLPRNDVGVMTDVLVGYSRAEGITAAVRTLSPDMIFCDEIAGPEDAAAILSAYGSGVRFAATIHAGSYSELMQREIARELLDAGVFTSAVFLCGSGHPSEIREIRRLDNAS
jgi:stage III sporulation protein AA